MHLIFPRIAIAFNLHAYLRRLAHSCASFIVFQILNPELVKSQLQSAMKEYLIHWVQIDKANNTVCVYF